MTARRWFSLTVGLVTFAWALVVALQLSRANADIHAGLRAVDAAKLRAASDLVQQPPLRDLRRARAHFLQGRRRARSPLVAPLRVVPVLGRQLRSVDALSAGAARVVEVAHDSLARAHRSFAAPHRTGPERLVLIRDIAAIGDGARRQLAAVRLGPRAGLFGPLLNARQKMASQLADVRERLERGAAGMQGAADLLGGPSRYLVLAANNGEMRAGSGMFLSAGVLQAGAGQLALSSFTQTGDIGLPPGAVPLGGDLAARWGWLEPQREWRNLGVSPRFDVTAPLAAQMWAARSGGAVDGVLAVDVVALAHLVRVIGPVDFAGQAMTADDVMSRMLHEQYVIHADDPPELRVREEEVGALAGTVLLALQQREWSIDDMARELVPAVQGRHLMVWSRQPAEQQRWGTAGVDGSLGADSLLVAVVNRGANKLDQFLDVQAQLELRRARGHTNAVLRLRLRNGAPTGEPVVIAGPYPDNHVPEGVLAGIVAVSLPGRTQIAWVDGDRHLAVAGRDGPTEVLGSVVSIPRGETREVVVRFVLPSGHGTLTLEPSARVPSLRWTIGDAHWDNDTAVPVRW